MTYNDFKKWLENLAKLNKENTQLNIQLLQIINNLLNLLKQPKNSDTLVTINSSLIAIIMMNLANKGPQIIRKASTPQTGINFKNILTAEEMNEHFHKLRVQEFNETYPKNPPSEPEIEDALQSSQETQSEYTNKFENSEAIIKKIDEHIKKLNSSKYNPFLSLPLAKIKALELLKDYLNKPQEMAPDAETITALIDSWRESKIFRDSSKTDLTTGQVLAHHRNLLFTETKETSTQAFVDSLIKDFGENIKTLMARSESVCKR